MLPHIYQTLPKVEKYGNLSYDYDKIPREKNPSRRNVYLESAVHQGLIVFVLEKQRGMNADISLLYFLFSLGTLHIELSHPHLGWVSPPQLIWKLP